MSEEELQMSEISASSPPKDVPCHKAQNEKQSHNNLPRSHIDIDAPKETYMKIEDCNEEAIQDESKENLNMTEISEDPDANDGKHCCQRCWSAKFQVYASHFLSSWGDRMWMFAGGLFLLEVTPGSLRLAAIYGAALALTVIVFGAPIGRWIDRTSRLTAAQLSLSMQNLMVCICAALLVVITTQRHLFSAWDGWSLVVTEGFVILTACLAQIGTLGSKLAIEKDWIIVICGKDKTRLARMNSVLRTVDLSTEVLAPVIVGVVMTGFGMAAGGIFIASWNVGSLVVEYGLLHHLFYSSADLQKPKAKDDNTEVEENVEETHTTNGISKEIRKRPVIVERLVSAWGAWLAYMRHPVRDAGLGLSLLFMTVLAFDNYSRAFVYDSGVSETILGVLTAVASLFGIFGSLAFPILRSKIGVTKTGLLGFGCESVCLTLCVASVFAPGSPFDASTIYGNGKSSVDVASPTSMTPTYLISNATSQPSEVVDTRIISLNMTEEGTDNLTSGIAEEADYTFVILLLSGIITSRFGLWVADLTVTQILQEGVEESHRGAINGVQSSLNQTLDLLRSVLLIIFPKRETFGLLIILSFVFVCVGWIMFAVYARRCPTPSKSTVATPEDEQLSVTV